jgi:hypothetical protein
MGRHTLLDEDAYNLTRVMNIVGIELLTRWASISRDSFALLVLRTSTTAIVSNAELVRAIDDPAPSEVRKDRAIVIAVGGGHEPFTALHFGCKSCSRIKRRNFLELTTMPRWRNRRRHQGG